MVTVDREISQCLRIVSLPHNLCAAARLLVCLLRFHGIADCENVISQIVKRPEINCPILLGRIAQRFLAVSVREFSLPVDRGAVIAIHALAGFVHAHELLQRLGQACLRRFGDELQSAGMVHLHVNAGEIGDAHEEGVRRIVILAQRRLVQQRLQSACYFLRIARRSGLPQTFIQPRKLGGVRLLRLQRQNRLFQIPRGGIFRREDIVRVLQQMRRDDEGEERALFHRLRNRVVEIFARREKFIVPNCHIPAEFVFVDQPHDLLRRRAVLLAVAQEDIGVERITHTLRERVADQHAFEKAPELFLIRDRGRVVRGFVQILQVAAELVEDGFQSRLLHEREDGDVVLHGIAERDRARGVGPVLPQKRHRDRHDEQLHLAQIRLERLTLHRALTWREIPDRRVRLHGEKLLRDRLEQPVKIRRRAAEKHARPPLRRSIAAGLVLHGSISHSLHLLIC